MKKQNGFTLIELIIVIIIIGILSAFAAPRFFDFSTDARVSTISGMSSAVNSAVNLAHADAILEGVETQATANLNGTDLEFGYPAASSTGIVNSLDLSGGWSIEEVAGATGDPDQLVFVAEGRIYTTTLADACQVVYEETQDSSVRPTITEQTDGC